MKTRTQLAFLAVSLSTAATAMAQNHYPAGVEGIKAASLPPPGVYLRDYNYTYWADKFTAGPPGFDLTAYVQVPRMVWISDYKVLGGNYGADVLVPFVYQNLKFQGYTGSKFGLGDICVEPVTLSWHPKQFDFAVGYAFWAPSGSYHSTDPVSPGKGFWTQMLTAGATWYPDAKKTWSLSVLNRYEFNSIQQDTGIRPGQMYTLEYGIAKALTPALEVGVAGYYQKQTTTDSGTGASGMRDGAAAIGPEITYAFPKIMLFTSLRYEREFTATDRPQGNMVNLTITKRF
jgi:hypothetical protein